jgi:nitrite reductase/ring-hydroxylating ferredoxin subunit
MPDGLNPDRPLCHASRVAPGQALGVDLADEGRDQFFIVNHQGTLHAWRNACPHVDGAPMAWRRHAYLSADGQQVMCHAHGARFEPDTGLCVHGPCLGQHLQRVPLYVDDAGQVRLAPAPT